jgi:hypothetical protein
MTDDSNSSRYLIYKLLHHRIFVMDKRGRRAKGVVNRVYRDIMDGKVELTVGEKEIAFPEPNAISLEKNAVVFVYGRSGLQEDNDDMLFTEIRNGSNTGESLGDVLKRTAPIRKRETRFYLEPAMA